MEQNILIVLNNVPKENLAVTKNTDIKSIKNYLKKYENSKIQMFITSKNKEKQELKVFETNEYDDMNLESVWKNMHKSVIHMTPYNQRFIGHKDVDMTVLKSLSDEDMVSMCKSNKYISQLCVKLQKEDYFWRTRLENVVHPSLIKKPENESWYSYYTRFFNYPKDKWNSLVQEMVNVVHPYLLIKEDAANYIIGLLKKVWRQIQKVPNSELEKYLEKYGELSGELSNHMIREYGIVGDLFVFYKYDRMRIIEYLLAEILELSGNAARQRYYNVDDDNDDEEEITISDIQTGLSTDASVESVFRN